MNVMIRLGLWIVLVPMFFVMAAVTLILIKFIELYVRVRNRIRPRAWGATSASAAAAPLPHRGDD